MKNKYIAGILALFLGWLGFHKFYLGRWVQGILYILFMFTFIPFIISLLEGLVYLINDKEWFDNQYNFDYMYREDMLNRINNKKYD